MLLTLFLSCGVIEAATPTSSSSSRPNVVLFLVDDMGVMDTSVPFLTDESGRPKRYPLNDYYRTPNMQRLADRGIRFSQFYAMSVCSPSRISIMTGQNAARHRTTNWINQGGNNKTPNGPPDWNWHGLNADSVTLPRLLKQQGYRTIHVGKAHFAPTDAGDPAQVGFDVNVAGGSQGHPASYLSENHYGHKLKNKKGDPHPNAVPGLEKYHDSGIFLTDALTIEAKGAVSQAIEDKRNFFLHLSHYAVHSPFDEDSRFIGNYPANNSLPNLAKFAALIEGMDRSLGELLDHLEAQGVAEETLVIFLGDNGSDSPQKDEHGVASSAPLRGKKGTHYEGGTRVPFIVSWAKPNPDHPLQKQFPIPSGQVQTQMANICDLFPTVLELCQIPAPENHTIDGKSLRALLAGQPDPAHSDSFLMHFPHRHRSVHFTSLRKGDWKVIYHYFPGPTSENERYQLFNLKLDPAEQENLAATQPEELRRMMQLLVNELEQADALYPVDESGQPLRPIVP